MCGRFDFHGDATDLEAFFGARRVTLTWQRRYNVAPTDSMPVLIGHEQNGLAVAMASFGWQRQFIRSGMVINARSETVYSRPLFRAAFASHRCVVPANGFFEWEKTKSRRLPWYFTSTKHPMFGLAGLYEPATDKRPAGFVILTTQPNELVAPYHNRMPVMFDPASAEVFVGGTVDEATKMLEAYPAEAMRAHRVSPAMNKAGYDGPDCISRACKGIST